MSTDEVFDVVVLGAGPAGEVAAGRAVAGGLSAAVVERRLAGGECSYYGCIPSKALLLPVELARAVQRMPGLTLAGGLDAEAVLNRRDEFVSHYQDAGQVAWLNNVPATLVRGAGRIAGVRRVEVSAEDGTVHTLEARHAVVVATGSDPFLPDIPGLAEARPWTNREVTSVTRIPRRLAVLGGGPVACEMAQALRGLGSEEVTLVIREESLLAHHEPLVGRLVGESFSADGIRVLKGRRARQVQRSDGGPVVLELDDGSRLEADELLVATGRRANSTDIGLETIGITGGGPIAVDDTMRVPDAEGGWLYAVGDVNGRNLLTHMGKYQARLCADTIVAQAGAVPLRTQPASDLADGIGAPQVIFTDPQVISVGRTEQQARDLGLKVGTVSQDIGAVAGAALEADGYAGTAKLVIDEDRRVLVGATFVGPGVVDLLHAATVAVVGEVPLDRLWHAVPAFPTVSEIWLRLLEGYGL